MTDEQKQAITAAVQQLTAISNALKSGNDVISLADYVAMVAAELGELLK